MAEIDDFRQRIAELEDEVEMLKRRIEKIGVCLTTKEERIQYLQRLNADKSQQIRDLTSKSSGSCAEDSSLTLLEPVNPP